MITAAIIVPQAMYRS